MMSAKLAMFLAQGQAGLRPQDVFATSLYTGNATARSITNGINLSGEGGLVWTKGRSGSGRENFFADTLRGTNNLIWSDSTSAQMTFANTLTAFNSNGYSIGTDSDFNASGETFVGWTFRRAPKFFDVVTYTGNGTAGRTIAHNLGVTPGMIIVKRTDSADNWIVRHRSASGDLYLDLTSSAGGSFTFITAASGTNFTVGSNGAVNGSGGTYVAYLFAHDTDSSGIVQCGTFNSDLSSTRTITLGWRPQFVLYKRADTGAGNWRMIDSARGFAGSEPILYPNLSSAESPESNHFADTSTGFTVNTSNLSTGNYIYLAIREPI